MLRSNLQLTAHMVLTKLPQEKTVFICQQIIKPDTGSDKDLFYLRKFSQLSEKSNVITVVCPEIFAGFREQALFMGTCPLCQLLFTGRETEIGCRPSHIVNVPLKIRFLCQKTRLLNQRFVTSCLNNPPLMEG